MTATEQNPFEASVAEWQAANPGASIFAESCARCGEDEEFSPNVEAFEISGELVCDDCAEEIFEDNGQFGVGA